MEMRCANCIANVEADLDVATFLHVGQKVFVSPNDEIYDKIAKVYYSHTKDLENIIHRSFCMALSKRSNVESEI